MPQVQPPYSLDSLPDDFPVFPLPGALLLPGGQLPLNIFEPRYLAMIDDVLGQGRMLGMVQPDKRLPEGDHGPGLYRTGCLGRITSFEESGDGRYFITLTGIIRFTIADELDMQNGYRRVRAGLAGFAGDLREADAELPFARESLLDALRRYFIEAGADANWEAIDQMSDAFLVNSLSMACPFNPEEKQALLEARDLPQRAETLRTLLEINGFGGDDGEPPKAN